MVRAQDATGLVGDVVGGAVVGMLAGLAVFAWELTIHGMVGLGEPDPMLLRQVAALYGAGGAFTGVLGGALRYNAAGRLAFSGMLALGWISVGLAALEVQRLGWPALFALVLGVPVVLGIAALVVRFVASDLALVGIGGVCGTMFAVAGPLNLHLLPTVLSPAGMVLNASVLLIGTTVGSALALVGAGGTARVAATVVVLGGVGGWLSWPTLRGASVGPSTWPVADGAAGPPIVLIVVGGLRADHLAPIAMPAMARRARSGTLYAETMAAGGWTLPAVGSLFTGRIPSRHGAGVNPDSGALRTGLPEDVPSLPDLLALRGYATAGVVSSEWLAEAYGFARGFGAYDQTPGPGALPTLLMPLWASGLSPYGWRRVRDAEEMTDDALEFVLAQDNPGWFLFVHYEDALGPWLTEEDREREHIGATPSRSDAYMAALRKVDRNIDRLLAVVPRDAWVVVVGDHGVALSEIRTTNPAPAGVWYGFGMYHEHIDVPMLVIGPGAGGAVVRRTVSSTDLLPTLLAVAGVPEPREIEGEALPEIVGGSPDPSRIILSEAVRWGPEQQAAREGRYKLIRKSEERAHLFDVDEDPTEIRPLIWSDGNNQTMIKHLEASMPYVGAARIGSAPPTLGEELLAILQRVGAPR